MSNTDGTQPTTPLPPQNTQPTTPLPPRDTQPTTPLQPQQHDRPAAPQQAPQPYYAQGAQSQASAQPYATPSVPVGTKLGETNTYALLAIVFAFVAPLAGIIFGHLALGQIKRTGDAGRGIALTGTIISYAYFAAILFFIIFYVGMLIMMFGAMGAAFSDMGSYDPYSYDF